MTKIVVVGNGRSPHCTERHLLRALVEDLGCDGQILQQEDVKEMGPNAFFAKVSDIGPDLLLYTRIHNNTALTSEWTEKWRYLERNGTRTASFHLDRFWDLQREHLIHDHDPLFTTEHVFTADGGNDERFEKAGVNHHWFPPGVDRAEALRPGSFDRSVPNIVFVGSRYHGHTEYPQRQELLAHLERTYVRHFALYGGGRGTRGSVRGDALNGVYATAKIVVGDSCFANEERAPRSKNYWSDRVPETIGRGGFLLHPYVPGIRDHYSAAELACYAPGDWDDLDVQIGSYLANAGERDGFIERGRARVLRDHTYSVRMRDLLTTVGLDIPVAADQL